MRSVGTKDTGPEWFVRRILFGHGYRYRLHSKTLPGHPDIVFPSRKKAIFVHGCFWHAHGCSKGQAPKSRMDYWGPKLESNRSRDASKARALRALGWRVLTVWQCQLRKSQALERKLVRFLET
jgi:DNA mismatch endonuclease (patch repair protein)